MSRRSLLTGVAVYAGALALVLGFVLAIILLWLLVFMFKVRRETENRIIEALETHYAPARVEVRERVDWKHGGSDWSFGGQVCFLIEVDCSAERQPEHRVAMVADDDDGGPFYFAREYPSMQLCKADFNRG